MAKKKESNGPKIVKEDICKNAFYNFFNNVTLSVYIVNKEGKFVAVNSYAEKMYGYDSEYFIGKTPEFISAPGMNDMEKIEEYHQRAFAGEPQRFYFWGKRKNGEIFHKEVRAHKAKYLDEEVLIVTGEDLSDREKLQEKIKISEERYKTIIDNSNDAIVIVQDERIVFVNKRIKEISGYDLDEILLKPFEIFLPPKNKEQLSNYYKERINGNPDLPSEYVIETVTKEGKVKFLQVKPVLISWGDENALMAIVQDVTEAFEERQQKETLRRIIENSSSVLFEWDEEKNGSVSFITNNIKNLLGYSAEDFLRGEIGIFDVIYQKDKQAYYDKITGYSEPGFYHFSQVYRLKKKDGEIIYVKDNTTIEIDEHSRKKRIYGIITDITEQYLLEREIREKEQKYGAVVDNVQDALVVSVNSIIVFVNKYLSELINYEINEIIGRPISDFIHPDDVEIVKDRYRRRMRGDNSLPQQYDFRLVAKEGKIIWVRIKPSILEWGGQRALLAFLRDITEEKSINEQLKKSEYKYRTIIENITEAIILVVDFKVKYFNPAFAEVIDADNFAELEDFDLTKIIYPDDFKKVYRNYKNRLEGKEADAEYEIRAITLKNKFKWMNIKSIVVDWEGEKSVLSIISDITEEKMAVESLKENELLLETFLDSNEDDIVCFKDGKGRWLKANKASLNLFQLQGVDYVGKTDADLAPYSPFYKDSLLACMKTDEECWAKGATTRADEIIKTPSGQNKIYDVIKIPIFNEDGTRKMLIVFGRNVTQQRNMENELRESQKQYKLLIDNLHESIVVTQNGMVKFFNPNFAKLTGYKEDELESKIIVELIHPDDRPHAITTYEHGFNMHISEEPYEFRIIRKDGTKVWALNHAIEINWINDKPAVMNFIRDITKEKLAYEQLNKLSVAVEQSEQGFLILDSSIKIEYANPYIYRLFDMNENDLLGRTPEILTPKDLSENSISKIISALIAEETWRGEVKLLKKNGNEFWGYLIITPIKNSQGELTNFLIIIIDIDEIKKIENELIQAKEAAEKNSKLKSYFLAQMSHEIRTPINAILSFAGLIRSELEEKIANDLRFAFVSMETAGKRIIRTIDLLLNMSEVQVGTYEFIPKQLDLEEIINSTLLEYSVHAKEKNVAIEYHKETDDVILPAHDEYSVNQIIANIVDNAVKYTKEGRIDITLGKNDNGEIFVEVKDTGIGISEEYLKDLFTPFSQEEQGYTRKYEGNGLGLALINEFVKLNNAYLKVKSKKGKGSSFTVIFRNGEKED